MTQDHIESIKVMHLLPGDTLVVKVEQYLTKQQLAQLLHVTPRTVNNYVAAGQLPAPIHVGRLALWSKPALAAFLATLQGPQ